MDRRTFVAVSLAAGGLIMGEGIQANAKGPTFFDLLGSPRLGVRRLERNGGVPALYIHGATFPSATSVGYRFADGSSWEDALNAVGFDAWSFDFEGFGCSARPEAFDKPADQSPIPLRSVDAAQQIARVASFIRERTKAKQIALIAHSWGTVPAMRYAIDHPELVSRVVLFAPILRRHPGSRPAGNILPPPSAVPAWRLLTIEEQRLRFIADTPKGHADVLAEPMLDHWGPAWLATDPEAATRTPPAVKVPTGPQADILSLWGGADLYDPAKLVAPLLIARGEWDSLCTAADVASLKARGTQLTEVVIPESGHLAHMEINRTALWEVVNGFLGSKP